ncbi:MAG: hypothetical protein NTX24_04700 [Candidatus Pacearchaeota archaeon]|nr:hypothetical protein [Candidatus Pacearchaeota archaeon]
MIKNFDELLKDGIVKKQMPNKARAKSLVKEADKKKEFLEVTLKTITQEKMSSNFVVDSCYDVILELIRAKMFLDGYNAGNSHEAEVSYLENLGFSEFEIRFLDEVRYYRNGIKYYGTMLTEEYAKKVLNFLNVMYSKLRKICEIK